MKKLSVFDKFVKSRNYTTHNNFYYLPDMIPFTVFWKLAVGLFGFGIGRGRGEICGVLLLSMFTVKLKVAAIL